MKRIATVRICLLATASVLFSASNLLAQDMFYTRIDYAVGDEPQSVFLIDFNGDGNNDGPIWEREYL